MAMQNMQDNGNSYGGDKSTTSPNGSCFRLLLVLVYSLVSIALVIILVFLIVSPKTITDKMDF